MAPTRERTSGMSSRAPSHAAWSSSTARNALTAPSQTRTGTFTCGARSLQPHHGMVCLCCLSVSVCASLCLALSTSLDLARLLCLCTHPNTHTFCFSLFFSPAGAPALPLCFDNPPCTQGGSRAERCGHHSGRRHDARVCAHKAVVHPVNGLCIAHTDTHARTHTHTPNSSAIG